MLDVNALSRISNSLNTVSKQSAVQNSASFSNTLNAKLKVPEALDPIFEEASKRYQVPSSLLKAVAKAESDFNPNAVSHAGAQGLMQLMPATAKSLGVSNSFDPKQNIMGGAKYLSDALRKYDGDVKLALAAYNAGGNNVDKYHGVPPFKETQNYVVKVMNYAQMDGKITVPAQTSNQAISQTTARSNYNTVYNDPASAGYNAILNSIANFDDFTTDDYMLFLELLKSNFQMSSTIGSQDTSDNFYQSILMNSRITNLF